MACPKRDELTSTAEEERIGVDRERANTLLNERCESGVDLAFGTGLQNDNLSSKRSCRCFNFLQIGLGNRIHWVHEHTKGHIPWHQLVQEAQTFRPQHTEEHHCARNIRTGTVECRDETKFDRIAADLKDNWDRCS